jgi:multidrug efflux pump subunit AcrA (membrane-fusion protein)
MPDLMQDRKPVPPTSPPKGRLVWIALLALIVLGALFLAGYLPHSERERQLQSLTSEKKTSLPRVNVAAVRLAPPQNDLLLPGNITPLTEASLNARADGYLKKRYADFGDHVKAGQLLAEIEAPELDQQVQQAQASLAQVQAALSRAEHQLTQSKANLELSRLTVDRWRTLADRGVVSKQEFDQHNADYLAQQAGVESAEADVRAASENIRATQANLDRLKNLQSYEKITAPWAGIVTARNVDVGALIGTTGSTPLFRLAQIDVLRIIIDVPETDAPSIKAGQPAEVTVQELPGRKFEGKVTRTANSLDANTRTLMTEVQVFNREATLMPNMFAQVRFTGVRTSPAILVPGDALVVRPTGTLVAKLGEGNRIHFQPIELGRDHGREIEVVSGIKGGDLVVLNPTDDVREGMAVEPLSQKSDSKTPGR